MSITDALHRYSRRRFIATHLAVVLGLTLGGNLLYFALIFAGIYLPTNLLGLIAALAPLVALHGAQRAEKITLTMSTVCALLLLACLYGVLVLIYLNRPVTGSWN